MNIENTYLATFSPATRPRIEKDFSASVREFFKHYDGVPIGTIYLYILKLNPAGNSRKLIKLVKRTADFRDINNPGVPASIWTEGTQGVVCLIQIEGMSDEEVSALISNGPYLRKKKVVAEKVIPLKDTHEAKPEVGVAPMSQVVNAETIVPVAGIADTVKSAVGIPNQSQPVTTEQKKILSPNEKLVNAGTSEEEIGRLKATMASIVSRECGSEDIPNTIVVSVENITKAILEHMKLKSRPVGEGGYRGIIANFYNARVALFGMKNETSVDPDAVYTDWIIDTQLVLDFVGGKDSLACLTRKREVEVAERLKEEKKHKAPPPTAEDVKEAAETFTEHTAILDLVRKMLDGKQIAEESLANAVTNRDLILAEVARLTQALALANEDLNGANVLVEIAEKEAAKFILNKETLTRIKEAKAKLDKLFSELNM